MTIKLFRSLEGIKAWLIVILSLMQWNNENGINGFASLVRSINQIQPLTIDSFLKDCDSLRLIEANTGFNYFCFYEKINNINHSQ